jgi:hypothetical protein
MLNPKHDTKPARIQAALAALGKSIVVTFEDAAQLHERDAPIFPRITKGPGHYPTCRPILKLSGWRWPSPAFAA